MADSKWKMRFIKLRDIFVPLLDGKPPEREARRTEFGADTPALKHALDLFVALNKAEDERGNHVQSKATSILGFSGVALSIMGFRGDFTSSLATAPWPLRLTLSGLLVISVTYLVVAILCATHALKVGQQAVVSPEMMVPDKHDGEGVYLARLARQYWNVLQANSYYNDRRADYLILSQMYLQRGLVSLLLVIMAFGLVMPAFVQRKPEDVVAIRKADWEKTQQSIAELRTELASAQGTIRSLSGQLSAQPRPLTSSDIRVRETTPSYSDDGFTLLGRVENQGEATATVVLHLPIWGADSKLALVRETVVVGLKPGEVRPFQISVLGLQPTDVSKFEVDVVNVF